MGHHTSRTKTTRQREVRTMFEPTRLAEDCLADAYAHLVPVIQRCVVPTQPATDSASVEVLPSTSRKEERP